MKTTALRTISHGRELGTRAPSSAPSTSARYPKPAPRAVGELRHVEPLVDGLVELELVDEVPTHARALCAPDGRQGSRGRREIKRTAVDAVLEGSVLDVFDLRRCRRDLRRRSVRVEVHGDAGGDDAGDRDHDDELREPARERASQLDADESHEPPSVSWRKTSSSETSMGRSSAT